MKKIKVKNMVTSQGNDIPNQFIIKTDNETYFQSYEATIVFINKNNNIYLDEYYWDFSKTTGKYRNMFLNETKKETANKIKSGEYILTNLN